MFHSKVLSLSILTLAGILIARGVTPQARQAGISVQMAATRHAFPVPDADRPDAWIVTVTADGHLYFGVEAVNPDDLTDALKKRLRNSANRLYIKADERAVFSNVKAALAAARSNCFKEPVLLTSQPRSAPEGAIVPPKGFMVRVMPSSNPDAIRVQLSARGQTLLSLMIDGKVVGWPDFESVLQRSLHGRTEKTVQIEASDDVPFAAIAHVLDEAQAGGAILELPSYHSL